VFIFKLGIVLLFLGFHIMSPSISIYYRSVVENYLRIL